MSVIFGVLGEIHRKQDSKRAMIHRKFKTFSPCVPFLNRHCAAQTANLNTDETFLVSDDSRKSPKLFCSFADIAVALWRPYKVSPYIIYMYSADYLQIHLVR